MEIYLSKAAAIAGMHRRGFTNDFQLFGNDLLWIQEKIFIRMGDFTILEYHRFLHESNKSCDTILFGVYSYHHNVKGILLNDYACYTDKTPPVIVKKLNEMNLACANADEVNWKSKI
jgi:hypothetical protein